MLIIGFRMHKNEENADLKNICISESRLLQWRSYTVHGAVYQWTNAQINSIPNSAGQKHSGMQS